MVVERASRDGPAPSSTGRWPMKSICHSSFGAGCSKRTKSRGVGAGASSPWRRRMAVMVLGAGASATPVRASRWCSLRPPQAGCSPRSASTARFHRRVGLGRRGPRPARAVGQGAVPARRPGQPLVPGLAADAVGLAQGADVGPLLLGKGDEFLPLRHDRALLPRHPGTLLSRGPACRIRCYPCLRTGVTHVPGLHTNEESRRHRATTSPGAEIPCFARNDTNSARGSLSPRSADRRPERTALLLLPQPAQGIAGRDRVQVQVPQRRR